MAVSEELSIVVGMKDFATKEFARLNRNVASFGKTAISSFRGLANQVLSVKGLLAGLGVAFTAKQIWDLVAGTAAAADEIQKMSLRVGISTEALSEIEFAAKRSGTSLQDFETAVRTGTKNLQDFAQFAKGQGVDVIQFLSEQFKKLVREGKNMDELLPVLSRDFKQLSEVERVFVASKLFGRAGPGLIPLLMDDITALRAEANRLGLTLSKDAADAAAEFQDALEDLRSAFEGLKRSVVLTVLPELIKGVKELVELLVNNRANVVSFFADLIDTGGQIAATAVRVAKAFTEVVDLISSFSGGVKKATAPIMESLREGARQWDGFIESIPRGQREVETGADRLRVKLEALADSIGTSSARAAERLRKQAESMKGAADFLDVEPVEELDRGYQGFLETQEANEAIIRDLGKAWDEYLETVALGAGEAEAEATRLGESLRLQLVQIHESENAAAGLKAEFAAMGKESKQFGKIAAEAARSVADSLSSNITDGLMSMIDGTKSAKEAFSDMAKSILNDLAKIFIQQTINMAIKGVFGAIGGFERGGIVGGHLAPVRGHLAAGDVVTQRGLYELREGGRNEAVVPLPDNRSIPVKIMGGGTGGETRVLNFTYSASYLDPSHESHLIARNREQIKQIVVDAMNSSLKFRDGMAA